MCTSTPTIPMSPATQQTSSSPMPSDTSSYDDDVSPSPPSSVPLVFDSSSAEDTTSETEELGVGKMKRKPPPRLADYIL